MLKNTFIHLPGIGLATERKLWGGGIHSWDDLAERGLDKLPQNRRNMARVAVRESIRQYAAGNWSYFDEVLPPGQKWRVYPDLGESILFVDIETTGLGDADSITLIGTYDGEKSKSFIAGQNLEEACAEISRHAMVVTFNGRCFDMPAIRRCFPQIACNHVHVDLRYPLAWLGFHGGLKSIERRCGLERRPETRSLDGWDAVRLWHEHESGSREALDLLVKYNEEDVRNLKPLLEMVCRLGMEKLSTR